MADSASLGRNGRESTRDRIVGLLRRGPKTVEELAGTIGLTDNGIRMHLAALEQAGTIRQSGVRRTGMAGKPATIFEMEPAAELQFSRAYAPLVSELVKVLSERLSSEDLVAIMRETGRRLAGGATLPGDFEARLRATVDLLNQLGALATVEEGQGRFHVQGIGCPLSAAVARCPEVCTAVEELLVALTGGTVEPQCQHGDRPACRFLVCE